MSEDIEELVGELKRKISQRYLILEQWRQLYSNPETVTILNKAAGLLFSNCAVLVFRRTAYGE